MLENKVKLVVWDLDDTFWDGTLAEGEIVPVERNVEIVKTLTARGIIQSICSKNDFDRARSQLMAIGVHDYFVFPRISFSPKGPAIAQLLEDIALRAENVLFIDDNPSNLEEVKHFNPGIMTGHPADVLGQLLAHPNLAGKPDPGLVRLNQYRLLERKAEERRTTTLSNEEFLRSSQIRISIEYDIEANFDRVLELINRSNQLNYTKVRVETAEDTVAFRSLLASFNCRAGCVRASDRYGDYGMIGFFLVKKDKLIHFVFSCRIMHLAIEQYIYEKLGRPKFHAVKPVAYGLDVHDKVDWIEEVDRANLSVGTRPGGRLVLIGGCELGALAAYCSNRRREFVNKESKGVPIRYVDPGFILSDRNAILECRDLRKIPLWTYRDAKDFDRAVAGADMIIISLAPAMNGRYFRTHNGVLLRVLPKSYRKIRELAPGWFDTEAEELSLDVADRVGLIVESLKALAARSRKGRIFVLGAHTLLHTAARAEALQAYNRACRALSDADPERLEYVDSDQIVPVTYCRNAMHFERRGHLALASHILERATSARMGAKEKAAALRANARARARENARARAKARIGRAGTISAPVRASRPAPLHNGAKSPKQQMPPFQFFTALRKRILGNQSWWAGRDAEPGGPHPVS